MLEVTGLSRILSVLFLCLHKSSCLTSLTHSAGELQ